MFFKSGGWRLLLSISLGCISSFKFYNCWEKLFGWLKHVMISRVLGKNKSIIIVVVFLTLFKWYKLFCNWCFLCVTNCWFKELCRIFLPNKKKIKIGQSVFLCDSINDGTDSPGHIWFLIQATLVIQNWTSLLIWLGEFLNPSEQEKHFTNYHKLWNIY